MNAPVFQRRAMTAVVALAVLSFVFALVAGILHPGGTGAHQARPDTRSTGGTGYRAFAALLRELKVPVADAASGDTSLVPPSLVIVIEPDLEARDAAAAARIRATLLRPSPVLLVLPKWTATPDPRRSEWVGEVLAQRSTDVAAVLEAAGLAGKVLWGDPKAPWTGPLGVAPAIADPQLLESGALEPLVASGGRMLAGARRQSGPRLAVLTDPDLLTNHGLHRGDNARLALALVDHLRVGPGPVVFDESLLPPPTRPSPWRALLTPPLLFATLQALLAALVVVWAALGRFGPPAPTPPPLPAGKTALVESTAALLRAGGHTRAALDRYLTSTLHDVASRLHAPPGLRRGELLAWLDQVAGGPAASQLAREVGGAPIDERRGLLPLARRIHAFRTRMLHGSR